MTDDHGVEEALKTREPIFDEHDRLGFGVAFVLAWGTVRAEAPALPDGQVADAAAEAADLSLKAQYTRGGWDAMVAGATSEKGLTVLEWLNSIPTVPPGVTA